MYSASKYHTQKLVEIAVALIRGPSLRETVQWNAPTLHLPVCGNNEYADYYYRIRISFRIFIPLTESWSAANALLKPVLSLHPKITLLHGYLRPCVARVRRLPKGHRETRVVWNTLLDTQGGRPSGFRLLTNTNTNRRTQSARFWTSIHQNSSIHFFVEKKT